MPVITTDFDAAGMFAVVNCKVKMLAVTDPEQLDGVLEQPTTLVTLPNPE